jgi:uncharacterized repeat protein (TIGR01451 family)
VDASGNLYIADSSNARIRRVNAAGTITTLVGGAVNDGGLSVFGKLNQPSGVARDNAGNTYVADTNNNRVRKVAANGTITAVAGTGETGFAGDGSAATSAKLNAPKGVALDASGNLYIADRYNYRVRMVSTSGTITRAAGNGNCGYRCDGGPATNAQLCAPSGVAVDAAGDVYIADTSNQRLRKVAADGTITTVAGNGAYDYSGDGGLAIGASFRNPYAVSVDTAGNMVVADQYNNAVRLLTPTETQPVLTIQSAHTGTFTQGQTGATYTLTVSNGSGAGPASGTVTVAEILPAGLTLVSMAGTGWTCTPAPTCTRSDALNGGSSYPAITVTVNVTATAPSQLTN